MTSGGWMDERKSSTSLSQRIKPLNSLKQGQRQKSFMFVKDKDKYHTSLGSMGPFLSSAAAVSGKKTVASGSWPEKHLLESSSW